VSQANVDVVKGIFHAWERGDFSSVDWADPDIEFSIPGPDTHVYRGVEAMGRAWAEWLNAFDEFSVLGEEFHEAGNKVVVRQLFRGKGKGSGIPIDRIPGAAVFTLRDGKVIRFEGHITLEGAMASAGLAG
jgi:ketosteroid isomerase-like protein